MRVARHAAAALVLQLAGRYLSADVFVCVNWWVAKIIQRKYSESVFAVAVICRATSQTVKGGGIMVGTEFSEVGDHIVGARDHVMTDRNGVVVMTDRNGVVPHLRWELEQVLSRVRPQDLSAAEVAGLLGILTSAHCRIVGGPTGRPGLGVLWVRSEDSAPQLA
jgi:hypothetical protein